MSRAWRYPINTSGKRKHDNATRCRDVYVSLRGVFPSLSEGRERNPMVTLGVVLLLLGLIFGISALWIIGLVLTVVGLLGNFGYARPRRRSFWY
jgi:hypothetical protein